MRILIAGCGYVGSELARQLAAQGHQVFGLRRSAAALPPGVERVNADLSEPATLSRLPEGLDFVFYTTGASGYSEADYRAAYVDGLRNLQRALTAQSSIQRLFFTSSTGVYNQDNGEWLDEDSPTPATRPTALALLEGEGIARSGPFPGTVVRFSGIYGPGRTRMIDGVAQGTARLERGQDRYLNHIHRDDCAGSLAHLMGVERPDNLYLATDDEPRMPNDLLRWIAGELGLPEPPYADESGEAGRSSERGGNRRYRNGRLRATGYVFRYPTYREGYGALIREKIAHREHGLSSP